MLQFKAALGGRPEANSEETHRHRKKKEKKRTTTKKKGHFDGDIPLSSEKGNGGFRGFFKNQGGRQRGTSDLTSAHMCAVGVTERRPSIMSRVPAGGTERVLRPAPK